MSTIEALRIQQDNMRLEKQQLEVENAHLRVEHLERAEAVDARAEQDRLLEEKECLAAEAGQLRTEYDQLVADFQDGQWALEELRDDRDQRLAEVQELECRNTALRKELAEEQAAELERYRRLRGRRRSGKLGRNGCCRGWRNYKRGWKGLVAV